MKFTITSITEEGLMAKEDAKTEIVVCWGDEIKGRRVVRGVGGNMYEVLNEVKEAEANRKEYFIPHSMICENETDICILEKYDRIEGDIKDNQIINIKIL